MNHFRYEKYSEEKFLPFSQKFQKKYMFGLSGKGDTLVVKQKKKKIKNNFISSLDK